MLCYSLGSSYIDINSSSVSIIRNVIGRKNVISKLLLVVMFLLNDVI